MNRLQLFTILIFGTFLFFGCNKWEEPKFNVPVWVGPTNPIHYWTIQKNPTTPRQYILRLHENGTPPDSIADYRDAVRYLRAVVVSSDEGGNYYKSMVVQDSTGGIELELDMAGLYNTYPVGQKVVIKLSGLVVGDYNNLPQIGWIYQGTQVGRINSLFIDKHIFKDGLPSLENVPKPLKNDDIDFIGHRDINKLVTLENVTFESQAIGQPIAFNDFITEWKIYVPVGSKKDSVVLRTSNYAKFRNTIIEDKTYDITGILTIYRGTYQFVIRTKDDIKSHVTVPDESYIADFTTNPVGDGKWSIQSLLSTTTRWGFRSSSMFHAGTDIQAIPMDDWLISPVITYPDFKNGFLTFEHQLPVFNGVVDAYQVYYTTSTATTFNKDDWKELGKITNFPQSYDWSNRLPISKINANTFRIAFRYHTDATTTTYNWNIKKVAIRNQ